MFHANRHEITKITAAFPNFANAPKLEHRTLKAQIHEDWVKESCEINLVEIPQALITTVL